MLLNEIMNEKEIVLLMGKLCSGKGYVCDNIYPDHTQITVSTIVKRLSGKTTRSELTNTQSLDTQIVAELIKEIDATPAGAVVDGIRQLTIVQGLLQHYGKEKVKVDWMDVGDDVRRERFTSRADRKDDVSFDDATAMDSKLGIDDVEKWARSNTSTHFRS